MSDTITIEISGDAKAALERAADSRGVLMVVAKELAIQNDLTVSHLVQNRLTGRGPFDPSEHKLGERTHLLRRSARATKPVINGDSVESSIGSNVKYAGIHEFGGTIKRVLLAGSVRLATDRKGNLLRQGKNGKLAVFARPSRKSVQTISFAGGKRYEITIPARAPFRTAIEDRRVATSTAISAAIVAYVNKGGQP